jgi:hypothetical protein
MTMNITRNLSAAMLAIVLGLGAAACDRQEGPAEELGEEIDDAAGKVKGEAKELKRELKDAAEDVEDELEDD